MVALILVQVGNNLNECTNDNLCHISNFCLYTRLANYVLKLVCHLICQNTSQEEIVFANRIVHCEEGVNTADLVGQTNRSKRKQNRQIERQNGRIENNNQIST